MFRQPCKQQRVRKGSHFCCGFGKVPVRNVAAVDPRGCIAFDTACSTTVRKDKSRGVYMTALGFITMTSMV